MPVHGRKKKKEKKLSFAALIIAICARNIISLYLSVFAFSDRRQYDHARPRVSDVKDEARLAPAGNPSEAELALLCLLAYRQVTHNRRCSRYIKLLNACRAKFPREVQILIRKLRDSEDQIGKLSQTYASRHSCQGGSLLFTSSRAPLEAKFITQQPGRAVFVTRLVF